MAKKGKIVKNEKRRQMAARYREVRADLKAKIADPQPPNTNRKVPMNSAPSFLPIWSSSRLPS